MKPNKKNIRKWVKALRSGKFKQGKGQLTNAGQDHCCLGVACVVAGIRRRGNVFGGSANVLPLAAQDFFGVGENPRLGDWAAAEWNDQQGKSFDEIADLIEAEYLK